MAKKGKYRGSSIKRGNLIDMYGVSDLLKSIEKAGGKVDAAVQKAVDVSLKIVGDDMQAYMSTRIDTGETYGSFELTPAQITDQIKVGKETYNIKGGGVAGSVGYNVKKGGLPAIFIDVYDGGTPKTKPSFFRYYAVENNRKQIEEIQRATLNEILEGLK